MDYSNVTGTLEQDATANVQDTYNKTVNSFASIPTVAALSSPAIHSVGMNSVQDGLTSTQKGTLTITGQPLNNFDIVYELYSECADDPQMLKVADRDALPKESDVHEGRWFRSKYYYVPETSYAKDKFFMLYLKTTVERQTVPAVLPYYAANITMVEKLPVPVGGTGGQILMFLKDQIPNDTGQMTIAINGLLHTYTYMENPNVKPGQLTDSVVLNVTKSEYDDPTFLKGLANAAVQLLNHNYPPTSPPPGPSPLEPIRSQVELLRLQNFAP
jgi:hypothetical protein